MTIDFSIIGKRIQIIRKNKGLSQTQLAAMSGISIGHLSHIENGLKAPSAEILINIAVVMKVSVDALLVDLNYPHNESIEIAELLRDCSENEKDLLLELVSCIKPVI